MSPVSAFSSRQSSDYYELHGPTQSADPVVPSLPAKSDSAEILDEQDYSRSSQTSENEGPRFAPPQPGPFDVEPVNQIDDDPIGVQGTSG